MDDRLYSEGAHAAHPLRNSSSTASHIDSGMMQDSLSNDNNSSEGSRGSLRQLGLRSVSADTPCCNCMLHYQKNSLAILTNNCYN